MATASLNLTQATYVRYLNPDDNHNANDFIRVGVGSTSTNIYYGLIQFPLTSIPLYSIVSSATLSLYSYSNSCFQASSTILIKRNTSSWVASTVTYNTGKPSTTDTNQGSGTNSGYDAWYNYTVTNLVQDWINGAANYGVTAQQNNATTSLAKCFYRSGTYAPVLAITYTPTPIKIAPTQGSINKQVMRTLITPTQGSITKNVTGMLIAPTQGSIDKNIY